MKFTASNALSPTLSLLINKGIRDILGGTEESFGVQGEGPKLVLFIHVSNIELKKKKN